MLDQTWGERGRVRERGEERAGGNVEEKREKEKRRKKEESWKKCSQLSRKIGSGCWNLLQHVAIVQM